MSKVVEMVRAVLAQLEKLEKLEDIRAVSGSELAYELFNEDFAFEYTEEAVCALESVGVMECVGLVQKYEQDNYDDVLTPLHNPIRVANMVVYIVGSYLVSKSRVVEDLWDDNLTDEEMVLAKQQMLDYVAGLDDPTGLALFEAVCAEHVTVDYVLDEEATLPTVKWRKTEMVQTSEGCKSKVVYEFRARKHDRNKVTVHKRALPSQLWKIVKTENAMVAKGDYDTLYAVGLRVLKEKGVKSVKRKGG